MKKGQQVIIKSTGEKAVFIKRSIFCGGVDLIVRKNGDRRHTQIAEMPGKNLSDYLR